MHSTAFYSTRKTAYKAARQVSKAVEAHFARHISKCPSGRLEAQVMAPTAELIEGLIDAAFWASLRREEGHWPRVSLALLPPDDSDLSMRFGQRIPLTPAMITKIAPGVERPGIHLGVWHEDGDLYVWGTTREISGFCLVLDVSEPGLLVIKHRHTEGFGKFVNVAVLIGDQVKIIDEGSAHLPDCPALLKMLLGISSPSTWNDSVNVLVQLAVSMRAHGRGGSLLVVPAGTDGWRDSIMHPMKYAVSPPFKGLAELVLQAETSTDQNLWEANLKKEVDRIAGLTAVDGATLINDHYELLAFGAKIRKPEGKTAVDEVVVTEPIVDGGAVVVNPVEHGGTRHLSAAQFVHDQQNALALVASQDGRFTVFAWSPCEMRVHAHGIATLLL